MNSTGADGAPPPRADHLRLLLERLEGLCDGDFSSWLEPVGLQGDAGDGVGDGKLDEDVDAVIAALNRLTEHLQSQHEELEARVEDRTRLLQLAHSEMEKLALSDPLTGLANRTALLRDVEHALSAAARGELPPGLLMIDLDSFKAVNDTLGHDAGDRVLRDVADRIQGIVRKADTVARIGGDEFAVLLTAITPSRARSVANRVLDSLRANSQVDGRNIASGASIGLSIAEPGLSGEQLMIQADTAMYAAKAARGTSFTIFEPSMLFERNRRMRKASDLRLSVADNQLVLHYQPVVTMANGRLDGVEALIRWNHPEFGLLAPADFVPLALETGQMAEIGQWVLRTALRQLREWDSTLNLEPTFTVRINLSAAELQCLQLPEDIRSALCEAEVDPARLVLEVSEESITSASDLEHFALPSLKALGVGLEIDNVGSSFACLRHLRDLPVDTVKLDRSLVAGLDNKSVPHSDPRQLDFLRALLPLISAYGAGVVVEGVETRKQADLLLGLGYTRAQGYLFGRPVPADEATALIGERVRN